MIGTCRTCAHWVPFEQIAAPGMCDRATNLRLGLCRLASLQTSDAVIAEDGSDYKHDLRTASTFGCTEWVANP